MNSTPYRVCPVFHLPEETGPL